MHIRFIFLTAILVVLMCGVSSGARTTRWPKSESTKKPPRVGSSSGGSGGFRRTTTTTTTSSDLQTDETTDVMMDSYTLSSTDSTTYPNDPYPTSFHSDAIVPPGNALGNYTLDYSECVFNICECCPPVKGPAGPMGEPGLPGPPGERGTPGKSFVKLFLVGKSIPLLNLL